MNPSLREAHIARTRHTLLQYMIQDAILRRAGAVLDEAGIPWVVLKGHHVATALYSHRWQRPSTDVDMLIAPQFRNRALSRFELAGLRVHPRKHLTHEICVSDGRAVVDLHWQLCRPGRLRWDPVEELVGSRVRANDRWFPCETWWLPYLLVHTAFTEHVTLRPIRIYDIHRCIENRAIRWDDVIRLLTRTGSCTAGWAVLRYARALFGTPIPSAALEALAPSKPKVRYIDQWLGFDPGSLYLKRPNWVRGAFSLALQDSLLDDCHALAQRLWWQKTDFFSR